MKTRVLAGSFAIFLGLATLGVPSAEAQKAPRELPENVKAWLEKDQLRRWANMIEAGKKRFNEGSCARCHGEGGTGGKWGPDLTDQVWVHNEGSLEEIREVIMWGVRRRDFKDPSRRFEMNPSGGMQLEWEETRSLAAYVWSLSNGTFLPDR